MKLRLVLLSHVLASLLYSTKNLMVSYLSSFLNLLRMETYKLLKIPRANLHVTLVVIQALGKVLGIGLTTLSSPVGGLGGGSGGSSLDSFRSGRAAPEHAGDTSTEGVANGRSDSDTGGGGGHLYGRLCQRLLAVRFILTTYCSCGGKLRSGVEDVGESCNCRGRERW